MMRLRFALAVLTALVGLQSVLLAQSVSEEELLFLKILNRSSLHSLNCQKVDHKDAVKLTAGWLNGRTRPTRDDLARLVVANHYLIESYLEADLEADKVLKGLNKEWVRLSVKTAMDSLRGKEFPDMDTFLSQTSKRLQDKIDEGRLNEIKKNILRATAERTFIPVVEAADGIGQKMHAANAKLSADDFSCFLRDGIPSVSKDFYSGNSGDGVYLECVYRGKEKHKQFVITAKLQTKSFSMQPTPEELNLANLNRQLGASDKVPEVMLYTMSERLIVSIPKAAYIYGTDLNPGDILFFSLGNTKPKNVAGVEVSVHTNGGSVMNMRPSKNAMASFEKQISPNQKDFKDARKYQAANLESLLESQRQSMYFVKLMLAKDGTRPDGIKQLQGILTYNLKLIPKSSDVYKDINDLVQKLKKDPNYKPEVTYEK